VRSIIAYYILIASCALCAGPRSALLEADRTFVQAAGRAGKPSLDNFLDADFTFTGADGRTLTRSEFLRDPPTLAAAGDPQPYLYGDLADVQANMGRLHVVRVWVKRPAGWKIIVYQEVRSLAAPPQTTPSAGLECQNPCKTVPYVPKNDPERHVLEAYSALETAAMARNSSVFATLVADEFVAASSNSNRTFTKPERIQGFNQGRMGGVAPTALVSAQMFDFAGAILMRSEHRPEAGKPLHVTRLWIQREGRWMEALSYQTSVDPR
jgi:hypothetical protein